MTVSFRFYGYLNDFLPPFRRGFRFRQILGRHWSVRDALVTLGVPYSRVAYPPFRSIDLGDIVRAGRRAS
jgi:hypothetical protein